MIKIYKLKKTTIYGSTSPKCVDKITLCVNISFDHEEIVQKLGFCYIYTYLFLLFIFYYLNFIHAFGGWVYIYTGTVFTCSCISEILNYIFYHVFKTFRYKVHIFGQTQSRDIGNQTAQHAPGPLSKC